MREYHVWVADGDYDFVKRDTTISAVRAWAKKAFPNGRVTVSTAYRFCDYCECAPCCGMVRHDEANS